MRIPFTGEYTATDWHKGIEEEREKSIRVSGMKSYFTHINEVSYSGEKQKKGADNFVSYRLSKMKDNTCEVIRVGAPVSYIRYSTGLKESPIPLQLSYYMLSMLANREESPASDIHGCFLLFDVDDKRVHFLTGSSNIYEIKRIVFPFLQNPNSDRKYYIYDRNHKIYYQCYVQKEELTRVSEKTNIGQIVIPVYRHIYYGYVNI